MLLHYCQCSNCGYYYDITEFSNYFFADEKPKYHFEHIKDIQCPKCNSIEKEVFDLNRFDYEEN